MASGWRTIMTHTQVRIWGVVIFTGALTGAAVAQTMAPEMAPAAGIVPSGFGEAVDRDVAKIRAATIPWKSTDAAVAAGYKQVTECIEHQPEGAMGYHFQ